ncbi:MAG: ABC transporter ATP-binding protein [Saccharofermentans sp.]|nr:ABC transporter ATP-binding protein [Clostridiales bacterium]MCR5288245.1 ABC transporter ATP-binding protein [Saccharofermentans sp.]
MALLILEKICKNFKTGNTTIIVHKDLSFTVDKGELVAIMGKSGCGKTTLLNILAGIDYPDSGKYVFDNSEVIIRKTNDGIKFRRNRIGVILQHFALINDFTVYENIELGLWEAKISKNERRKKVNDVLERLGIWDLRDQYPDKLSGGEKQRVAIGRAIVCEPILVLADEPTGSLDNETEKEILEIIKELNKSLDMTFIIVTHDEEVAACCDRTITLQKL